MQFVRKLTWLIEARAINFQNRLTVKNNPETDEMVKNRRKLSISCDRTRCIQAFHTLTAHKSKSVSLVASHVASMLNECYLMLKKGKIWSKTIDNLPLLHAEAVAPETIKMNSLKHTTEQHKKRQSTIEMKMK
jgi:hypothetical protein